ncbi:heavy metal translocating P-type ATPase [Campylobacter sp. MIT 97-5078]|uniref:heavy metal translocating P-type ATPase n=1 Tax=Campylobacter sp. MIT 97-5078 TaxID=1548153 RepID=UPI00051344BF|nr:cation-translocating P-type ATPase [Campylobacter sp. MIT 97-5078]KGI56323.1 metal ABC transporter ATPase [Campylobacter sp. MIT 97-5078]KGI57548.1 metal ABC transporter ATPase [Campylobacter sp. MIT 97-5078]KGI57755.1 metal ABC transporter ATPase [Campylobacter sp. MIT 97-5078]TQR26928.1 copper-translocating P-type ATPase [Campylobacter sp. MIT 97-5078]
MQELHLKIGKMTCTNCSNAIERICSKIQGVEKVSVSYLNASGIFLLSSKEARAKIQQKIKDLGYEVLQNDEDIYEFKLKELQKLKFNLILSVIISALAMLLMMSFHGILSELLQMILGLFGVFYCGRGFFVHAFKGLKNLALDMNTLVSLGSLSAVIYSFLAFLGIFETHLYFAEASMIISFVLLGKFLEENAKFKANSTQKGLENFEVKTARLVQKDGSFTLVNPSFLQVNDEVLVKEGESISVDGVVLEGKAEVDMSVISGEFMPLLKQKGDSVEAGGLVVSGLLRIRASKKAMDSNLEHIKNLIFQASNAKMPITLLVDKLSAYFVGTILILALITFIAWWFIAGLNEAFLHSSALLLVSCPCALGLATPIALVLAIHNASKHHILIKNPSAIELLRKIKEGIFDKTGTLSEEKLSIYAHNLSKENFELLSKLEYFSTHPIANAIKSNDEAQVTHINKDKLEFFTARGLLYTDEKDVFLAGNETFLKEKGVMISQEQHNFVLENAKFAPIVVYFAKNKTCLGCVCLQNELRKEAYTLIASLKALGIKSLILSGDNEKSVKSVAQKLDIKEYYANLKPEDKLEFIKKRRDAFFVGDGVNDAASLRLATVSFALNAGSNLAKENGDFILIKDDLIGIDYALKLSKKTFSIIRLNLFWACIYNALCIPLAAGLVPGISLSPHIAALAMCFSSLCVVMNSLRLKKDI